MPVAAIGGRNIGLPGGGYESSAEWLRGPNLSATSPVFYVVPRGGNVGRCRAAPVTGEDGPARKSEGVDVTETASISNGIASRYATAVFSLAQDEKGKGIDALASDVDALEAALATSDDLRTVISSPLYSRDQQAAAVAAVAKKMGLGATLTNVLGLMASKRRLFVVPQMLRTLRERIALERGEVTAEVMSAKALTKTQSDSLAKTLSAKAGKDVKIKASVDESLIGGLVVKMGSQMIDTSIASKLKALQNFMKEAR